MMHSHSWLRRTAICLTLISFSGLIMAQQPTATSLNLVFDNETYTSTIKSYRCPKCEQAQAPVNFIHGIEKLNSSASGQFSESNLLTTLQEREKKHIWIIDLRSESHAFVDGQAISWYGPHNADNQHLTLSEITQKEKKQISDLVKQNQFHVGHIVRKRSGMVQEVTPELVKSNQIETESELTYRLGYHYVRLPVVDRNVPNHHILDELINLVETGPKNAWYHFHCRAGKGRATTFMVLYDIIKNGDKLLLNDIIERQAYFGGKDLRKLPVKQQDLWKLESAKDRLQLLKDFHQFRQSPQYLKMPWSEWITQKT